MPSISADLPRDRYAGAVTALAGLAMGFLLVTPRASPAALAMLVLLAFAIAGRLVRGDELRNPPAPLLLLIAICLWAGMSTLWAVERGDALGKAALTLLFGAAAWLGHRALGSARPTLLRQAGWTLLVAFGAGLAYLAQEEMTGHLVKRIVYFALPFLRLSDKHMAIDGGDIMLAGYVSNRSMGVAVLALWPMLLMVQALVEPSRRLAAALALAMLAAVTFAMSMHETSVIAIAGSAVVFALGTRWPRVAIGLIAAAWIAATLLVVPAASWGFHKAELHRASWLPNSARHRIVLWGYTADHAWNRPLTGIGATATKFVDNKRGLEAPVVPGTKFQWRSGTHAHNFYLQTWYEMGAVGALMLCAFGLSLLHAISRLPGNVQPYATAAFAASAAMAATSWGMWQPWLLCAFAIGSLLFAFAMRLRETAADTPQPRPPLTPDPAPSA